jgi:hypothetical protein
MLPCFRLGAWAWEIAIRSQEHRPPEELRKLVLQVIQAHKKAPQERTAHDVETLAKYEEIASRPRPIAPCKHHGEGCAGCATLYTESHVGMLPECAVRKYDAAADVDSE